MNRKRKQSSQGVGNAVSWREEIAIVPTDVLAEWVTDRGRCVWEAMAFGPITWTGDDDEDRDVAAQVCAGCPVRAECLELEVRTEREYVDRAWDELHPEDRAVLQDMWSARFRPDVQATLTDDEDGAER